MKKRFMRHSVAAVAGASLLLVGLPLASPASAVEACALGATCEGSLDGDSGPSPFIIQMPEKFNGTVMMYFHGVRIPDPVPAGLAIQLGLVGDPNYSPTTVPGLGQAIPALQVDTAFVANNRAEAAPNAAVASNLLAQGYALAGPGYSRQGWAPVEGVEAGENLLRYINSGAVKGAKRTVVWGSSMGGYIASAIAERNPGKISGVLPMCGALVSPEQLLSGGMTALFTWKQLLTPSLKVANYAAGPVGYFQAVGDVLTVLSTLGNISAGTLNPSSLSPVGYPYLQANLLSGLMAGLPTKSAVYDGDTINPAFAQLGLPAAVAGGYVPGPIPTGQSTALAMLENSAAAAVLGVMLRYDLEKRARTALSLTPADNANFNDNVSVRYSRLLSVEQRNEFGDILNASALLPGTLRAMEGKLDASVGDASIRYPANPAVVKWINSLMPLKGDYTKPIVLMTTTFDTLTPAGNQGQYTDRLQASFKKQGKKAGLNRIVSLYTIPSPDGYTRFGPGLTRTPNAAETAAANTSGVGHCQFAKLDNGVQFTNAVVVLNRLMNAKTQKQVSAAKRIGFNTAGVNNDRGYTPDALKRPLATVAR
jgi:pimeloyl-ACP methyl ester carboxylesterase